HGARGSWRCVRGPPAKRRDTRTDSRTCRRPKRSMEPPSRDRSLSPEGTSPGSLAVPWIRDQPPEPEFGARTLVVPKYPVKRVTTAPLRGCTGRPGTHVLRSRLGRSRIISGWLSYRILAALVRSG